MIQITFAFNINEISAQEALVLHSQYPWLKGSVCIFDQENICAFQDVPVVGMLFELYERYKYLTMNDLSFILVSDDVNYNIHLIRASNGVEIHPDWGIKVGTLITESSNEFVDTLIEALLTSYSLNCLLVPVTRSIVLPNSFKDILTEIMQRQSDKKGGKPALTGHEDDNLCT